MTTLTDAEIAGITEGTCDHPFSLLGMHEVDGKLVVRVHVPGADRVEVLDAKTGKHVTDLPRIAHGLFDGPAGRRRNRFAYRLRVTQGDHSWETEDAYAFGPVMGALDEHLIGEGSHRQLWRVLGAHVMTHEGVPGVHFAVWAPNASRVSVIGDFNSWDGRRHLMRRRGSTGVWEIFIPRIGEGAQYKYELLGPDGALLPQKADPFGFGSEHPPAQASIVRGLDGFGWHDGDWLARRQSAMAVDAPVSIYEVHLGSWRRVPEEGNRPLSYNELARDLVAYVKDLGFTHIELMPISEFPFEGSWGYQPIGLFAPTIRHGTLQEFRALVDACHGAGLGLVLDWVPGHFPQDQHGLGRFDGTPLYEHGDPREGFHPDWNTLVFNYGRREVANYLTANALYWLDEHHVDGLRVDAVASMLYRDYSRKEGEWVPNQHGGRENLEAIAFLQSTNTTVYGEVPGVVTIAEESTAFPGVSGMADQGGLGFGYKWNMGWMNDTLRYMAEDPINRKYHHDKMTFGLHYAFTENFVLPISHDEVVHGKGSLLDKMPGDGLAKFANLRAYLGFMWGHPGKKLLFMGCEFAQGREWNHDGSLDWHLLDNALHQGVQRLVRDLNVTYTALPALHERDTKPDGFSWVEGGAVEESLFIWLRHGKPGTKPVLVICNMTPVTRAARRVGVPAPGFWAERINTDAADYGGSGAGNLGGVQAEDVAAAGQPHSIVVTVPPLATLIFALD